MITRIRQYDKKEPSRDAHKLYVICEGARDEPKYFGFFEGLSSNLNVITIPSENGETDPVKLSLKALERFDPVSGKYSLDYTQGDRVWFVVDTDTWEKEGKISALRAFCAQKNAECKKYTETKQYSLWNVAQSNPCFEIWLYYHFYEEAPSVEDVEKAVSFKHYLRGKIHGGFNYESDPVRLKDAIANAEENFAAYEDGVLPLFATEVFELGKEIYPFVADELAKLYNKMG